MKVTDKYVFFWGGPFSQWSKTPFQNQGITFQTAEHYMMYQKALILEDDDAARRVLLSHSPKVAKSIGRSVKASQESLDRWDKMKFEVVVDGNMLKFSQHEDLKEELLSVYPRVFVEASPYDKIWGIGLKEDDPRALNEDTWRGKNLLGKALTEVAERLHGTDI